MANETNSFEFHMVFGAGGFIAIGLPTGVCNLLIAASILKYSAMRDQNELVILMGLALADGINLVSYVSAGVYRLFVVIMGYQYHLLTSFQCMRLPHLWLWSFTLSLSNQMLVAVSVDRLLLVSLRAKYLVLSHKYAWGVVGGLFTFNIVFGLSAIIFSLTSGYTNPTLNSMCYCPWAYGSSSPISLAFQRYTEYGESLFPFASVLVFACTGPMYLYQRNKVTPAGSRETEQRMKFQHKLTRSIAVSCLSTLLLACIPGRLGYMFMEMDMMLLSRVCWLLVITNPMANVLIYHIAHRDMRTAMHGLLCCKILPLDTDLWPANVARSRSVSKSASRRVSRVQQRYVETEF